MRPFSNCSHSLLVSMLVLLIGLPASATAQSLSMRLASGHRPEEDKARDAGREPGAVIDFLGIEAGMTVLDVIAAGGYYSEVLSEAVGPAGHVYAQNTDFILKMRDGANEKAISARLADNRLPNVERLNRKFANLGLAPASLDAAITALNFHDIYNSSGPEAATGILKAVKAYLKPGGLLGIIDHAGNAGADNTALHRIEESNVALAAEKAGFIVEARSDVLRNSSDDRSGGVFGPGMRGATDRFVLKLRKPR